MNYVGLRTAAQHLGRSESWLRKNLSELGIPHHKLGGRFEFQISEIDEWRSNLKKNSESLRPNGDWPRLTL